MSQVAYYVSFQVFSWSPSVGMYICVVVCIYVIYLTHLIWTYFVYIWENYMFFHVFLCHNNYCHQNNFFCCWFFMFFLFLLLLLILESRERVREKEKHRFVVPCIYSFIGWWLYVPWLEIEPSTLAHGDSTLTTWAPGQGSCSLFLLNSHLNFSHKFQEDFQDYYFKDYIESANS